MVNGMLHWAYHTRVHGNLICSGDSRDNRKIQRGSCNYEDSEILQRVMGDGWCFKLYSFEMNAFNVLSLQP